MQYSTFFDHRLWDFQISNSVDFSFVCDIYFNFPKFYKSWFLKTFSSRNAFISFQRGLLFGYCGIVWTLCGRVMSYELLFKA